MQDNETLLAHVKGTPPGASMQRPPVLSTPVYSSGGVQSHAKPDFSFVGLDVAHMISPEMTDLTPFPPSLHDPRSSLDPK